MNDLDGVLFVTVGTSALTARRLGDPVQGFASGVISEGEKLRKRVSAFIHRAQGGDSPDQGLFDDIIAAHELVWKNLRERRGVLGISGPPIGDQVERTSAELTSTYFLRLTEEIPVGFLGRRWRVILLASSTPEGQLAGRVDARLMHDFLLTPRCKCDYDRYGTCEKGRVCVVTVPGLEAAGFSGSVSQGLLDILDGNRANNVICNITGGFKGTIPIIAVWASRHGFPLFYQHERARECVRVAFDACSRLIEEKVYPLSALPTPERLG